MAHATPPQGTTQAHGTGHGAPTGGHGPNGHHEIRPLDKRPHIPRFPVDEDIYGLYYHHPIVFLRTLIWPALALVLLLAGVLLLNGVNPAGLDGWLLAVLSAGNLILLGGLLVIGLWIVYNYKDWRDDYLLISPRRVIVCEARPGLREFLREVPMGKVQNVITHHAHLREWFKKLLHVGSLVIDTAGMGQIHFDEIREQSAHDAQTIILDLQKGVRAATQMPREQYRRDVMRHIIVGAPPPPAPHRIQVKSHPRSGYDLLNRLIPRKPWREGLQVIWHRHWWFLITAELVPLMVIFLFELTTLAVGLVGNALQLTDNPVLNLLTLIRPVVYLLLLPFALWQWEDWRNDKYIVNKDSLISLDTLPFGLEETVKQTEIRRVVDATVRVEGVRAKLLGFGNVVMKTPGEATSFIFEDVPHPFDVHQEIMNRIEAQREQEQAQWDRDIQEWLRAYVDERRAEPAPPPPPPDQWSFW
ncbi:MAG TPA: hypothetical protein VKY74_07980 [Chloroflexia bacterium]|nr:hypothetical protein [Chloroflexia bacterium]